MEARLSLFIVHLVSRNDKRGLNRNDGNVLTEANALGSRMPRPCRSIFAIATSKDELRNSVATANLEGGRGRGGGRRHRKKTTKLYQAGRNFLFESNGNYEFPLATSR